ncbi:conjugal transfer protein TraK [Salinimicrobium sp. MT39]|uniref:Conjugal transfer protein TraK n=1 Tax=Salinimicrobium profundisediminis TaxID=2994553 RepID=A0A9X3CYI2_9FLAO|nr:conjugal transfer protein TraK [Salinimicrobium profundisediminis]MCX2839084.1 conjugal transfer protein TraK [Salinimicrobium profundisediminis]
MKTPYMNIYSVLKINRFIVMLVVSLAFLSSALSLWSVFDLNQKMLNSMFAVNTDGSVIPLKLSSAKENLEVEALAHLEMFHQYFYGIDASNYEKHLEKALWLGNSSVDNIYRQKKADGLYNRLIQYSLVQKVQSVQTALDLSREPYEFRTTTIFEINRGKVLDEYELITTGKLIHVDRHFPRNSHGLLITDFFENSLKKLSDESR